MPRKLLNIKQENLRHSPFKGGKFLIETRNDIHVTLIFGAAEL